MSFVDDRFKERRKSVVIKSSVGRTENSSASLMKSVVSIMNSDIIMLMISSASSSQGGSEG
jgi:hypothetical protein